MNKLSKLEKDWILYDIGNSVFILLVSTIMPIYFNYLVSFEGMESHNYLSYWGYATSVVTIIVFFIGPVVGAISDIKGFKKKMFFYSVMIGVVCLSALGLGSSWLVFLSIFIIAKVAYSISIICYDSMLSDITLDERMDKISSVGYALGYIGSCIPFIVSLLIVLGYKHIGITFNKAISIVFIINGLWWFLMSFPLLKNFKQKHYIIESNNVVYSSIKRILLIIKEIKKDKCIFFFLIGFFFYIDGVYTIIDMATAYGKALGLESTGLLLALLLTQIVAVPCTLLFGKLSEIFKSDNLITIAIIGYIGIAVFAIFITTEAEFWILAIFVGIFQGGIQALSRSHFAKIIPHEKSGQYFGILDICGKGAAFFGTTLVSIITQVTGSANKGVSIISIIMIIGLIMFKLSIKKSE